MTVIGRRGGLCPSRCNRGATTTSPLLALDRPAPARKSPHKPHTQEATPLQGPIRRHSKERPKEQLAGNTSQARIVVYFKCPVKYLSGNLLARFAACLPLVCRLSAACLPLVCRLSAACLPLVCRLSAACLPLVCRLSAACLPLVCRLSAACLPLVCRLSAACLPLVCRLSASCLPVVCRVGLRSRLIPEAYACQLVQFRFGGLTWGLGRALDSVPQFARATRPCPPIGGVFVPQGPIDEGRCL